MTQDERWLMKCRVLMDFMEMHGRRPSKYAPEEKLMHHWIRYNTKQYNRGEMKKERVALFEEFQETAARFRRINQYE